MIIKGKQALNRRGHLIFSLALAILSLYFLNQRIEISEDLIMIIIFHTPIYFFFSLFPDIVSHGGRGLVSHRFNHIIHSYRVLIFLIIMSPILLYLTIISPLVFEGIANHYSLLFTASIGVISHLIGDSLTSRLPR